jgi:uncharacterized protein HemX
VPVAHTEEAHMTEQYPSNRSPRHDPSPGRAGPPTARGSGSLWKVLTAVFAVAAIGLAIWVFTLSSDAASVEDAAASEIDALQTENDQLAEQISALEEQNAALDEENATLEDEKAALEDQNAELQEQSQQLS